MALSKLELESWMTWMIVAHRDGLVGRREQLPHILLGCCSVLCWALIHGVWKDGSIQGSGANDLSEMATSRS